jgi:nucleotide-binding universal stress UspA family protein
MYQLKRIMVCVDLSTMDEEVICYASEISEIMEADTIYFLHVAKDLNLPEDIAKKYKDVLAPIDETIKHQVEDTVSKYFNKQTSTKIHIDVLEGQPTDLVIKYAKRKDVDLIVMGKHRGKERPKIQLDRVVELSHCSVLYVPKKAEIKIDTIVVAMDFSEHAKLALEQAIRIKEKREAVNIYGLHVYHVPSGYHMTGKSYEEFAEIMKGHAQNDARKFFKKHKADIDEATCEMHYALTEDDRIDDELNDFATNKNADVIMIGSQGRTAAAAFLLGSVAEHILHYDNNIPVFVVKKKNENMSFLQALMKI